MPFESVFVLQMSEINGLIWTMAAAMLLAHPKASFFHRLSMCLGGVSSKTPRFHLTHGEA